MRKVNENFLRNRKGEYGNETPFSWGPLFHLVVFGLCFGSAFILDALTRLSVPREDPTDALNRFAEYLVSDIPNPKKSCGVIFLLLLKRISRVSSDTRRNFFEFDYFTVSVKICSSSSPLSVLSSFPSSFAIYLTRTGYTAKLLRRKTSEKLVSSRKISPICQK